MKTWRIDDPFGITVAKQYRSFMKTGVGIASLIQSRGKELHSMKVQAH